MALDTGNYAIITKGRGDTQTVSYPPDTTYGYLNSTIDAIPGLRDVINAGGKGMYTQLQNAMSNPVQYSELGLLGALANGDQSQISANAQFLTNQGKDVTSIQTDLNVLNQQLAAGESNGFAGLVGGVAGNILSTVPVSYTHLTLPTILRV